MAIINMNQLFDELKKYIDKKIDGIEVELRDLFEEYGLKEIQPYLNEIKTVADNLEVLVPIGQNLQPLINIGNNLDPILDAPEHIVEMEDLVDQSQDLYDGTVEYNEKAYKWAMEDFGVPVDDGLNQGYSSFHWSETAKNTVYQITLKGEWDPNSGAYPTPTAHGDYWIVNPGGNYDGETWYAGDSLVWIDDGTTQEWGHKQEAVHWLQIVGKPSAYTPKPHYHSEYVQNANLVMYSPGPAAAGYPVKLDPNGLLSNTMIKLPVVTVIGWFTPVPTLEYPEPEDLQYGYSWLIQGVHPTNGYTFLSGTLIGRTIRNGDILIYAMEGWIIQYDKLDVNAYLRRDGTYPMLGNLSMGDNRIIDVNDGIEDTDAATVRQLGTKFDEVFSKDEFIAVSGGTGDQGKPIVLNEWGLVDETMVNFNALTLMGQWDPSAGQEYPDTTGMEPGAYWKIEMSGQECYTFTGGDLNGKELCNGNYMVWAQTGWITIVINIVPEDYYRLDGANPLLADFNGGGYKISHIVDGTEDTDAPTYKQLTDGLDTKADTNHTHTPTQIQPQGTGSGLDADYLDGYDSSDFMLNGATINPGQIQPQGAASGLDADTLDGSQASDFRLVSDSVDWSELSNVPTEFTPPKANQTTIGGIRIWADGDILNIATDDYVAS